MIACFFTGRGKELVDGWEEGLKNQLNQDFMWQFEVENVLMSLIKLAVFLLYIITLGWILAFIEVATAKFWGV